MNLIGIAIRKTLERYGYKYMEMDENTYVFEKKKAKGEFSIRKLSGGMGELVFRYKNSFNDRKTDKDEFTRYKGTNVLENICGERFSVNYLEPRQFTVSSMWTVALEDASLTELTAIVTRCISVAESCYTVLNSDFYYSNDASRALLEADLKAKVKKPGGWSNSGELPLPFRGNKVKAQTR